MIDTSGLGEEDVAALQAEAYRLRAQRAARLAEADRKIPKSLMERWRSFRERLAKLEEWIDADYEFRVGNAVIDSGVVRFRIAALGVYSFEGVLGLKGGEPSLHVSGANSGHEYDMLYNAEREAWFEESYAGRVRAWKALSKDAWEWSEDAKAAGYSPLLLHRALVEKEGSRD